MSSLLPTDHSSLLNATIQPVPAWCQCWHHCQSFENLKCPMSRSNWVLYVEMHALQGYETVLEQICHLTWEKWEELSDWVIVSHCCCLPVLKWDWSRTGDHVFPCYGKHPSNGTWMAIWGMQHWQIPVPTVPLLLGWISFVHAPICLHIASMLHWNVYEFFGLRLEFQCCAWFWAQLGFEVTLWFCSSNHSFAQSED